MMYSSILAAMLFCSGGAALILGLLQTALESRRDQWAFLMHRGIAPTHIFLGKVIAGMVLYATVLLPPLLLAAVWCSFRGIERFPFEWRMLMPGLLCVLVSFGLYFAAMLIVIRQASWYGSRLLPSVVAVLTVMLVPLLVFELQAFASWPAVLGLSACVAIMAIAAWGAFVRSGQSDGVPLLSRICQGTLMTIAFVLGVVAVFASVTWFVDDVLDWESATHPPYSQHRVNRAGHIVRFDYSEAPNQNWNDRTLLRVVDLDDPSSTRYQSLVDDQPRFDQIIRKDLPESLNPEAPAGTACR